MIFRVPVFVFTLLLTLFVESHGAEEPTKSRDLVYEETPDSLKNEIVDIQRRIALAKLRLAEVRTTLVEELKNENNAPQKEINRKSTVVNKQTTTSEMKKKSLRLSEDIELISRFLSVCISARDQTTIPRDIRYARIRKYDLLKTMAAMEGLIKNLKSDVSRNGLNDLDLVTSTEHKLLTDSEYINMGKVEMKNTHNEKSSRPTLKPAGASLLDALARSRKSQQ